MWRHPGTLAGTFVRLEPLAREHEDGLWEASRDPRTWTWLSIVQPETRDELRAWLDEALSGPYLPFATVLIGRDEQRRGNLPVDVASTAGGTSRFPQTPSPGPLRGQAATRPPPDPLHRSAARTDDYVVGSTRFMTLRPEHRSVEIGWTWLAPTAWGTGANVEAKLLMLEQAFDRWGCRRVELKTDALNERSRGAMEALGAVFEGVHRKHLLVRGGENRDSAWYSVVDDEWPVVRARLEARLAASGR
jgi:RimJ/RimL family protein N-acetyltransferase